MALFLTMTTSYADSVKAGSKGRQSSPTSDVAAPPNAQPPGVHSNDSSTVDTIMSLPTEQPLEQSGQLGPRINPTKLGEGESLPDGYAKNYAGFLIKTTRKRVHVSEELVVAEVRFLQDHMIVASFVGRRPSSAGFDLWLSKLNAGISGGSLSLSGDLGWGFTCLKASSQLAARQALLLIPCRIDSFLCIFQQWTPNFDPSSSKGMLIPTWITLKNSPFNSLAWLRR